LLLLPDSLAAVVAQRLVVETKAFLDDDPKAVPSPSGLLQLMDRVVVVMEERAGENPSTPPPLHNSQQPAVATTSKRRGEQNSIVTTINRFLGRDGAKAAILAWDRHDEKDRLVSTVGCSVFSLCESKQKVSTGGKQERYNRSFLTSRTLLRVGLFRWSLP